MAGKDGGIDQHVAIDLLHAGFFQHRHHVADILAFEGGVTAKAGDEIAFQLTVFNLAFGLKGGGKTEVRPELKQGGERSDHLLGTGRQRHLLTVVVNLWCLCPDLLHHQCKVSTGG